MAKFVPDEQIDRSLSTAGSANWICVCSNQPTNGSGAFTTYMLARQALTTGCFVYADGTTSGRKITMSAYSNIPVTTAGSAQHVAWVTTAAASSALNVVTTCDSQYLYTTGSVTVPAFSWEIADVTP
jgi:hypothetical protein